MPKTQYAFEIFDASAGSGKTYTLVKDYLYIILKAERLDAYRNILAITFTNKAVHNMKSRIVDNLSEFAKDIPNAKSATLLQVLALETGKTALEIKTKSKQIIKHLIHNYAAFDISTIDKFTHRVIRTFAHDLGLSLTFEVTLDTESLLTEAVDGIIAQAGQDPTLTKLLVDFTMEKTDNDKSWDISREIMQTGKLLLNENNRNEVSSFKNKSVADFLTLKDKLKKLSTTLFEQVSEKSNQINAIIDDNNIDRKSFSRGTFPNHINYLRDDDERYTNHYFYKSEDIKINKTAVDSDTIEHVLPQILRFLAEIYTLNKKRNFYNAFLKNITPLSLLSEVSNELRKIQTEQNTLSISEFNALIYSEIQNQPAPFIYERLGERYRHFFIDEFQDTSEMQWQNLIPLIDNALAGQDVYGQKGTLMLVGDPKQSIYRWRGGKAEQFIALCKNENPFSNKEKNVEPLETNFRSFSEIIDFNNAFFKGIASEFTNADYKDLYENKSGQFTNTRFGGFVNIQFIPKPDNVFDDETDQPIERSELYCKATLETIQSVLTQGFIYKDIAILTRKRQQGIDIANYLTENGIPILSSETLQIQNATEVQQIIHILKYLRNPSDNESKAEFLYALSKTTASKIETHDFLAKGISFVVETDFEWWLNSIGITISFADIRKKSLYEIVETIINLLIHTEYKFENNEERRGTAYLQYFLDIVLERDSRNQSGINDFIEFWDQKGSSFSIPSPEGTNAVRILTVHKAKGLEYPVVIFPFADEDYGRKPKDSIWVPTDEAEVELPKILIDNTQAVKTFGEAAETVFLQKKQEELLDNINVLYVALTRAEEQLYIISTMNIKADGNVKSNTMSTFFINFLKSKNLWHENENNYHFGIKKRISEKNEFVDSNKKIELVSQLFDPKNIKISQLESVMWGTERQEAIEYGNIVHEILSYIKVETDVDLAIQRAVENGIITDFQKENMLQTILSIVTNENLLEFFSSDNKILNEQFIIQKEDALIKPDRMVINALNEVFLLDYKTGDPQTKYKSQLEKYEIAIEKMGYKIAKKSIVYIGTKIKVENF